MQSAKNLKKQILLFLYCLGFSARIIAYTSDQHFVIIIPSRNNSEWCERNISMLVNQDYDNWHAIYINDASTDDTGEKVAALISYYQAEDKIILINNETRQGAMANIYKAVYMCDDSDVAITYDGDDWFSGTHVLSLLNQVYADENVWLTYGSYQDHYPFGGRGGCSTPTPQAVVLSNSYRKDEWRASHLRTFYAWLFKSIKTEDLMIDDVFFSMTYDQAIMFPMLEMAGGRFKYIYDILYTYNMATPNNDHKINQNLQKDMENIIRARAPYEPLGPIIISTMFKTPEPVYVNAYDNLEPKANVEPKISAHHHKSRAAQVAVKTRSSTKKKSKQGTKKR